MKEQIALGDEHEMLTAPIDWFFVFNVTFSTFSGVPGENHRPWESNW